MAALYKGDPSDGVKEYSDERGPIKNKEREDMAWY
jgi:hypothetical protein